jgi:hypothetical protein
MRFDRMAANKQLSRDRLIFLEPQQKKKKKKPLPCSPSFESHRLPSANCSFVSPLIQFIQLRRNLILSPHHSPSYTISRLIIIIRIIIATFFFSRSDTCQSLDLCPLVSLSLSLSLSLFALL